MAIYERELGQAKRDIRLLIKNIMKETRGLTNYSFNNGIKVCSHCGCPIKIEDNFCRNCGNVFKYRLARTDSYVGKIIQVEIDKFLARGIKNAELEEALKELLNVEKRIAKIKEELLSYEEEGEANDV